MKTAIYYFSGTGNTLITARNLVEKIPESELIPVSKVINEEKIIIQNESLGIVFPLYFFGLPQIISQFIKKADLTKVKYIFCVVTMGFPSAYSGGAMTQLKQELSVKGKKLSLGSYVNMADNFIIYWWNPTKLNKIEGLLKRANEKTELIAAKIAGRESVVEKAMIDCFFPVFKHIPWTGNSYYQKNAKRLDKYFQADEKCNGCNICARVCPVKNIEINDSTGKPTWLNQNCQQCLACIHFCPTQSIQFGKRFMQFGKDTSNKRRYHYPGLSHQDLYLD